MRKVSESLRVAERFVLLCPITLAMGLYVMLAKVKVLEHFIA